MRLALLGLACALSACSFDPLDRCVAAEPGDVMSCPTPDVFDRAFDVRVPASWDGVTPLPLIYGFHGGGGHRTSAPKVTCPNGDLSNPDCLTAKANAAGYAVVYPDGTGNRPARNIRTWNAGGGTGEWHCVSGVGCSSDVDDMAYLDTVHEEVQRILPVDATRVYATGLSNGGAISHRLACERPARLAAIATVGGANQYAAAGESCPGGVAVLQIHGTEDPCWGYRTSTATCLENSGKKKIGGLESTEAWAARNGCDDATDDESLPNPVDDRTSATRMRWQNCASPVELIRIDGGGHTWPQGDRFLSEGRIGRLSQDFDGDDVILEFFGAIAK